MIVGTAGHIDHGKTSLVRALSGRNTDRLPEEIARGISIELGYAYVPLEAGAVLGYVDVPGHERFVHTMVAGATGIDLALLVVAADDGPMPQTDEHLDILRLLGVARGALALTKVDAVEPARVAEVRDELAHRLAGSAQAGWPLFEVSAVTGHGVAALDAHLRAEAAAHAGRAAGGEFRLAIDRVFTLAGVGTVVAGTVHAGRVQVGDEVAIEPGGPRARVRSLHAQDRPAAAGQAGERVALALAGVEREAIERGQWAQSPRLANVTERFDATLHLSAREAARLATNQPVHLHHGTRDLLARVAVLDGDAIEPGATALVHVSAAAPLALCRGDRFIVRDASASRTIGGGVVLDIAPPARHRRAPERLTLLTALRDAPPAAALAAWLARHAVPQARLAAGWNLRTEERDALLAAIGARVAAGVAFAPDAWRALVDRTLEAVAATHLREPEMPGLEQTRARRIVAPTLERGAFDELLDELLADGRLMRRGAFLALPDHKAELAREERVRWEQLKPRLMEQRFGPPRVRDLARDAGLPEGEVRALLRKVARVGEVTLVALDHFFLTGAVAEMADIVAELSGTHGAARAAAFRDRIGGGRKVAIQILEFFDRVGYTRRVRDEHLVRRGNPWRSEA